MKVLTYSNLKKIYDLMLEYDRKRSMLRRNPSVPIGEMHALDMVTLDEIRYILGIVHFKRRISESEYEES